MRYWRDARILALRYWHKLLAALMMTGVARAADGDAGTCRMPGDTDRRIAACTRLTDDNGLPPEVRALALTSRGLARAGKWVRRRKGAMADYDEAIRLDPRSANARLFRSSLFRNAANHDRAIDDLSEAIRIDPGVALFYNRAAALFQKLLTTSAIADFNRDGSCSSPTSTPVLWPRPGERHAGLKGRAMPTTPKVSRVAPDGAARLWRPRAGVPVPGRP